MKTLTLQGTGIIDTGISSDLLTTNGGSDTVYGVGDGSSVTSASYRFLIKPDLSSIPAGSIVTSVTLSVYEYVVDYRNGGTNPNTVSVRRLLRNWVESEATWSIYSTGNNWTTGGASSDSNDRVATASATFTVSNTSHNAFIDITGATLTDDVQKMVNGTYSNYGWLFNSSGESNGDSQTDYNGFYSTNYSTDTTLRPKLVINYINPIELNSTGALKADASLKAYYRFEGNSNDETANNHDGTDTDITYNTSYGVFGQGILLNGSSSKIVITDSADLKPSTSYSISCWIKTSAAGGEYIFHSSAADALNGIAILKSNVHTFRLYHYPTGSGYLVESNTPVDDGNWHFCVATYDGSYIKVYVDGKLDCNPVSIATNITWTTNYVRIGMYATTGGADGGGFYNGSIDDLAFWNGKALTATEVEFLYNQSLTVRPVATADGTCYKNATTFAAARAATSATLTETTSTSDDFGVYSSAGDYYLQRLFIPFITSGLPDSGIIIGSANLHVKIADRGEVSNSIELIQTSQADSTTLVDADYDNVGSIAGATRTDYGSIPAVNNWLTISLNTTGLSWINTSGTTLLGLREGTYDVDNSSPAYGAARSGIYLADSAGNEPYLVINYTEAEFTTQIQTISAQANIQEAFVTKTQTCSAKTRIQKSSNQTVTAKARIEFERLTTVSAMASIGMPFAPMKITQVISLLGSYGQAYYTTLSGGDWFFAYYDPAQYSGIESIVFEAAGFMYYEGYTGTLELWDMTNNVKITDLSFTEFNTSFTYVVKQSADIKSSLTSACVLAFKYKTSTTGKYFYFTGVKVKINQNDYSCNRKTTVMYPLSDEFADEFGIDWADSEYQIFPHIEKFDGDIKCYLEAHALINYGTSEAKFRLFDITANAAVSGSELTFTNTSIEKIISGELTLIEGHEYKGQAWFAEEEGSIYILNPVIKIVNTGFSKTSALVQLNFPVSNSFAVGWQELRPYFKLEDDNIDAVGISKILVSRAWGSSESELEPFQIRLYNKTDDVVVDNTYHSFTSGYDQYEEDIVAFSGNKDYIEQTYYADGSPVGSFNYGYVVYFLTGEETKLSTITVKAAILKEISQIIQAKGQIKISTSKTIQTKARITISNTQTLLTKSDIKQNISQILQAKTRIKISSTQVITAKGQVKNTKGRTILTKARIESNSNKNILAKADIKKNTNKNIQAKARITNSAIQTISSKANIKISTSQTLSAKGRISQAAIQTEQSKANIKDTLTKTLQVKANFLNTKTTHIFFKARISISSLQNINSKARIIINETKSLIVKARIETGGLKIIIAKANIKQNRLQGILSKANIKNIQTKQINAKARIELSKITTVSARGNIKNNKNYSLDAKARITISSSETLTVKGRISTSANRNIQTLANIKVSISRNLNTKARIEKSTQKTIQGKGRIEKTETYALATQANIKSIQTKTVISKGRITTGSDKNISTKASILKAIERTVSVKSAILRQAAQTLNTKARISATSTKTIITKGRIDILSLRTVIARGNIKNTINRELTTKSRIETYSMKTISIKGRVEKSSPITLSIKAAILKEITQTLNVKSMISSVDQKRLFTKGNIRSNQTKSVLAKGRLQIAGIPTINVKANIKNTFIKNISAKAAISKSFIQIILARAVIKIESTANLFTKANIQKGSATTVSSKARINITRSKTITFLSKIERQQQKLLIAKGSIKKETQKIISAKGRIQIGSSSAISSLGRISNSFIKTVAARGNIIANNTATITVNAIIESPSMKIIQAKARITLISRQTIFVLGRIFNNYHKNLTTKGNIRQTLNQNVQIKAQIKITSSVILSTKARIGIESSQSLEATARIISIVIIEIVDKIRSQEIVQQISYVVGKVTEISYNKIKIVNIHSVKPKVNEPIRNRVTIANICEPSRINQIKWLTARAKIITA